MTRTTLLVAATILASCTNDVASSGAGFGSDEGGESAENTAEETGDDPDTSGGAATETGSEGGSGSDTDADAGETEDDGSSGDDGPQTNPVAEEDGYVVAQSELPLHVGAAQGLLANDADDDGDTLEVVQHDAMSSRGAVVVVAGDGALEYDPPAWIWGEDSFSYTTQDPDGNLATATVRVVVRPTAISLNYLALGFGGFVLDGEGPGDWAGSAVGGGGDINGDGVPDLVVGAFGATPSGGASGRTYAVHAGLDAQASFLSSVAAGQGGFVIDGETTADLSGESVTIVGDVNGDAIDDVLVGARGSDQAGTDSGRTYLVFGGASANVSLSDVVLGGGGFAINGEAAGDFSGVAVAAAGDVNDDGLGDFIVSAPYSTGGDEFGRIYVVFGKQDTNPVDLGDIVAGVGGFAIDGEDDGDRAGLAVGGAGDVNGDGLADIIVGASRADPNGASSGRAYLVFGKANGDTVALTDITDGVGGFTMDGAASGDRAGSAVDGAGDVNGDGLADLIIGAFGVDGDGFDAGAAYIVFGKADTNALALNNVADGGGGFAITAVTGGERVGSSVAGVGDLNGDGLSDIVLGAAGATDAGPDTGRAYVIYGKVDGQPVGVSELGAGDGTRGFALLGTNAADQTGRAVAGLGDLNGDGFTALVIGAPGDSTNGQASGRIYVLQGVPTEL